MEPAVYRKTVHLFGATSSPGCANFGLKKIANDGESKYGKEAANFVKDDFYVDDGLSSFETAHQAIHLIENTTKLCRDGGLGLHKFVSNSKEVIEAIPIRDKSKAIQNLDLNFENLPIERALGIQWCIESDTFQFRIELTDAPFTRRNILSTLCSVYDPLGLISPVILRGKQILQQLCKEKVDWDTPLSEEVKMNWES